MFFRIILAAVLMPSAAFAQTATATASPKATTSSTLPTYLPTTPTTIYVPPTITVTPIVPEPTFHTLSVNPFPVSWILREYGQGSLPLVQWVALMIRHALTAWNDQVHTPKFYSTTGPFVPSKITPGVCSWRRKFVADGPRVGYEKLDEYVIPSHGAVASEDGLVFGEASVYSGHQRPAGTDETLAVTPSDSLNAFGPFLDFGATSTGSLKTWVVFTGDAAHQYQVVNGELVGPWEITESTKPTATLRINGAPPAATVEVAASIHVTSTNGLNARAWGALTDREGTGRVKWATGLMNEESFPTSRPVQGQDGVGLALAEGGVTQVTKNTATSDVKSTATGLIRIKLLKDGTRTHDITAGIRDCELNVVVTGKCRACGSGITTTWATEPAQTPANFIQKIRDAIAEAKRAAAAALEEMIRPDPDYPPRY